MPPISYNLSGRSADPLDFLVENPRDAVMAVITNVEGPSYRPVGAFMAIGRNGARIGSLSSGCIEGDLVVHAARALDDGQPRALRYGQGSPFMDISLPCGGGLDILLLPNPDLDVLGAVRRERDARRACILDISVRNGAMEIHTSQPANTAQGADQLRIEFVPEIRFLTFGKGPEASTFAALVASAGYPGVLCSPDEETCESAREAGCETRLLDRAEFPKGLKSDPWTAVLAFFHEHDWEPPILASALQGAAFYVGAQGSMQAAENRRMALADLGVSSMDIDRMRGPIGLIPSARDARTLAVSVLAEVLETARKMRVEAGNTGPDGGMK